MARFYMTTTALWLAFSSSTTTAFVPQAKTTSRSSFVGSPLVVRSPIPSTSSSSNTMLSMNLFDRFTKVAQANLNSILQNLEDPEKIMEQAVEDMQKDLVKIRQSYAEVTATQRRMLKQKEQADAMATDWYKRAQLALQKGAEDLAREALTRRQTNLDEAAAMQSQIDVQAAAIDKLYEGMQVLEKRILESKAKKDQMAARARTAQSTQKVNDMLSGITGKSSMDAFTRMEQKVEALEAAAEVSAEMGSMGGYALPGTAGSSIENQFKALEAASSVDSELDKLKGLLNAAPDDKSSSSSSSSSSNSKSSAMDDELEKLKREAGL